MQNLLKCKKIDCIYEIHSDISNNDGTHCCKACMISGNHGPKCENNICKINIDLVYTYVNGFDEELNQKRNMYMKEIDKRYNPPIRYNDINELNYSLKTAIKFVPWINKIYIITDNQIPVIDNNLLNNEKIKIIDHTEIIPSQYLPIFCSDIIESFIHNIPNLSEIFLYNNDDMFFFDKINKNDIYEIVNHKIKLKILHNYDIPFHSDYTISLLKKLNINKPIYNHITKIYRKSTLKYVEEKYQVELHQSRLLKFRNPLQIKYVFFILNIEEYLNNNILIPLNKNNFLECNLGNDNYSDKLLKFFVYRKCKFVCYNSMNQTFKEQFKKLMNMVLKE
jgi:hypothetical protein